MTESEHYSNNPAGRLYLIMSRAVEIADNLANRNGYYSSRDARVCLVIAIAISESIYSEAIDNEEIDENMVFIQGLNHIFNLIKETKSLLQIKSNFSNVSLYSKAIDAIQSSLLMTNFNSSWMEMNPRIDKGTLVSLEFCADFLSQETSENFIKKDELAKLRNEVNSLISNILNTDLETDFKTYLIEKLKSVEDAILSYHIYGSRGLKNASESSLGSLLSNLSSLDKPQKKKIVEDFFKIIANINALVGVGDKSRQFLLSAFQKFSE